MKWPKNANALVQLAVKNKIAKIALAILALAKTANVIKIN